MKKKKILNEYYKEIEKRDELNIEINQIHKKIELENEDLINNESSLKNIIKNIIRSRRIKES